MKILIGGNAYDAGKTEAKSILRVAKQSAFPGSIYAIQKKGIIILLNDTSDGTYFRKNGYKTFRRRSDYGGCHNRRKS